MSFEPIKSGTEEQVEANIGISPKALELMDRIKELQEELFKEKVPSTFQAIKFSEKDLANNTSKPRFLLNTSNKLPDIKGWPSMLYKVFIDGLLLYAKEAEDKGY